MRINQNQANAVYSRAPTQLLRAWATLGYYC